MMLLVVGCSHRTAPVDLRERLAFDADRLHRALDDLVARYGCEAVIVSTCNRVEFYLARPDALVALDAKLIAEFLAEFHELSAAKLCAHLYEYRGPKAVGHLFRVAASLDSMIVGEGQIAGQVKRAYEVAQERGTVGPILHLLLRPAGRQTGAPRDRHHQGARLRFQCRCRVRSPGLRPFRR